MSSNAKSKKKSATRRQRTVVHSRTKSGHLTRIEIKGFRGFDPLQVDGLSPVTLVTGLNGTGKSTLLEAAFAIFGRFNPAWILSLQASRELGTFTAESGPNYSGLFSSFRDIGSASITGYFSDKQTLRIVLERSSGEQVVDPTTMRRSSTQTGVPVSSVLCKAYTGTHLDRESRLAWVVHSDRPPQFRVENGGQAERHAILLDPKERLPGHEAPAIFGKARLANRSSRIVEGLRLFDPRIEDIEYVPSSAGHQLVAKMDNQRPPLGLLGAGINHYYKFLLALDHVRGGLACIDEIENGIHHTLHEKVFGLLLRFAVEDGTQLIVSTHSAEALEAIGCACAQIGDDVLSIVHLQRDHKDNVEAHVFRGVDAVSSVRLGYEMR